MDIILKNAGNPETTASMNYELTFFYENYFEPFWNQSKLKYEQLCNKEIERNLENLIYILNKTYRNGNDMIWSIDINGKKWTRNSLSVPSPFPE